MLSKLVVVIGFGCGGINVCIIVNVLVVGNINDSVDMFSFCVMVSNIGIIIIKLVLKKIGKLNSKDVMFNVNGVCCLLNKLIRCFVSILVLLLVFSSLLIMLFNLISNVIVVNVLLNLDSIIGIMLIVFILLSMVVIKFININVINVCMCIIIIRNINVSIIVSLVISNIFCFM